MRGSSSNVVGIYAAIVARVSSSRVVVKVGMMMSSLAASDGAAVLGVGDLGGDSVCPSSFPHWSLVVASFTGMLSRRSSATGLLTSHLLPSLLLRVSHQQSQL